MKWISRYQTGISALLILSILTGCSQPAKELPVSAPQNVIAVPSENDVTVVWEVVNDSRVTGYNVYQNDKKVNPNPVSSTQAKLKAAETTLVGNRPLTFIVPNVDKKIPSKFSVRALTPKGEGLPSLELPSRPLVCPRYKVEGTDMGAKFQNIRLTRGVSNLSTATVKSNSAPIPYVASSAIYQGNLPSVLPVGAAVNVLSADGDCLVFSYDFVPESTVLVTPTAGESFDIASAIPVSWTSATNPDRFVVSATWVEGTSGFSWRSGDLAGTVRSFSVPANSLPANTSVKIRVYAYNDGTENFIGSFETGSKMAIRNGDEVGRTINTTITPPPHATLPGVSWGDPHLITFDQLAFGFQSVGEFDLAISSDSGLRVQSRHQPWGGSRVVSVNTAIATEMNGQKVGLYINPPIGESPLRVGETGTRTTVPLTGLDLGAGYRITQSGSTYTFQYPSGDQMILTLASGYINLKLFPASTRAGTLKGLLGNMDGNLTNEFVLRNGTTSPSLTNLSLVRAYADSWSVPSIGDSLFVYDGTGAFGSFADSAFPVAQPARDQAAFDAARAECEAAGVQPKNLDDCATDKTQTGDAGFVTGAADIQQPAEIVVMDTTKPDLTITSASLNRGSVCRPYRPFVSGTIVVKNTGSGIAPANSNVGIVQFVDIRDESLSAGYRGNGNGIPELAPGESAEIAVDVFYPINTPGDTEGLRQYIARVDFGNLYNELNESNNRFSTTLEVNFLKGFCKNKVAYIIGADSSAASSYHNGLTAKGLRITDFSLATLNPNSTPTLMDYDLIVIDTKTGYLDTWEGATGIAQAIYSTGRPVLGLGEGGYSFFGKSSSPIGWPNGWHDDAGATAFTVPTTAHSSNNEPFVVDQPGGIVGISSASMPFVAIYQPTETPAIQKIGRQSDDVNHFIVVANSSPTSTNGSLEAIWGFDGVPSYTENGWKALANLAWFMLP